MDAEKDLEPKGYGLAVRIRKGSLKVLHSNIGNNGGIILSKFAELQPRCNASMKVLQSSRNGGGTKRSHGRAGLCPVCLNVAIVPKGLLATQKE